jgi:large exoprotein involved in heme utilization and adhesion
VTITARNLLVDGQGSSNYSTGILSGAFPDSTGNGGQINLTLADTLTVRNGGRIDALTSGKGDAGGITVSAGGAVAIAGGNQIDRDFFPTGFFVSSVGTGNAGDLTVTTPRLTLADGGKIQATSTQTTGGNLFINADHLKLFDSSEISSSVAGNELSDGGNVTLSSTNIVALKDSKITAQANQGRGGNIIVNAEVFLHDAASISEVLNASSQVAGNDGAVRNNAPTTDISGSLVALNTDYLDAAGQLSPRCGVGDPDERSRFTIQGRGALPLGPDDPGMAPASRCGLETLALTSAVTTEGLGNDLLPTSVADPPIPTTFGFNNR